MSTESDLRARLATADKAMRSAEERATECRAAWRKAKAELEAALVGRYPEPHELTYAYTALCAGCSARMAYWPDASGVHGAWDCSAVLLGTTGEQSPVVLEHAMGRSSRPAGYPKDVVLHDRLPFVFWKVLSEDSAKRRGMEPTGDD